MHLLQAVVLAILQGVSELFPVSSLGHAVILPALFHWSIKETGQTWLAFLVALHIGTATALLIYFWDDWKTVIMAFVHSLQRGEIGNDPDQRLAWMVVLGTIPTGIVGAILQPPLSRLFAKPMIAACFLIVNGGIMFFGEWLLQRQARRAQATGAVSARPQAMAVAGGAAVAVVPPLTELETGRYRDITQVSWRDAAIVGFAQIGALIPGISRSGITMVAGLAAGLTHEAAARYAFLLATPIILGAGLLELPQLFTTSGRHILGYAVLGAVLAGIAAYLSVRFLMKYFEFGRLYPFAYYCVGAGILSLVLLRAGI
jgi:undecaprenyl-diphosphatase